MKKAIKVSTLLLSVATSVALFSCSKEKEELTNQEEAAIVEQPTGVEHECSYVDSSYQLQLVYLQPYLLAQEHQQMLLL